MLDGFALLVEVDGVEVLSRVLPPEPVMPAMPRRVVAKRRERTDAEQIPAIVDVAAEVVS